MIFFSIRVSTLPYINNKAAYPFCSPSTVLCVKRRLRESSRLAQKPNPNLPPNMVFKLSSTLDTSHSLLSYFLSIHWYVSHLKPAFVQDSEHQFSQLTRNIPNTFFFISSLNRLLGLLYIPLVLSLISLAVLCSQEQSGCCQADEAIDSHCVWTTPFTPGFRTC